MLTEGDKQILDGITVAGSHPAKYNVFEVASQAIAEKIPGCWVEAGACGGGQIAVMDYALRRRSESRILHAFDSWEGIPKALDEDDEPQKKEYGVRRPGEPLVSSGKLVTDLNNFWGNMRRWGARLENIKPHKGWLQDTTKGWFEPIGLLRIDVDLTDSVRVCAQNLYPYLVSGGYCIFDDWYMSWSPQRQVMIDLCGHPLSDETVNHVEGNPGTVWWRKP